MLRGAESERGWTRPPGRGRLYGPRRAAPPVPSSARRFPLPPAASSGDREPRANFAAPGVAHSIILPMHHRTLTCLRLATAAALAVVAATAALTAGCSGSGSRAGPPPQWMESRDFRALWVTRWDYRTPEDVTAAIDNAASVGVTDVIWQVRGQADAFYASPLEPWGQELLAPVPATGRAADAAGTPLGASAAGPGFDPLELAVRRAHEKGIRLHAWVNVYPLWRGKTPPADPRHPFHARPKWRLTDQHGKVQELNDHYVIANPVLPEVQDHIVAVCRDIVTRYDVDGLHLDYVRFVSDSMDEKLIYPSDPVSLGLFRRATGRSGVTAAEDRAAFQAWKRDQITHLVRRIRLEAVDARRDRAVMLSAAVWRRPEIGRETYLQDAARWLAEGTVHRVMPMIYTEDDAQFRDDLQAWLLAARGRPVTPGIGAHAHDADTTRRQIALASRASGYALFAYSSFFDSADRGQKRDPQAAALRSAKRTQLAAYQGALERTRPAWLP